MRLESIEYTEFEGQPREWSLDRTEFGPITLLVGKNASGKSRTLHVMASLARLLNGSIRTVFTEGVFKARFQNGDEAYEFCSEMHGGAVISETVKINDETMLSRGPGGEGLIFANELNKQIRFQTPENKLSVVARRDSIQHPWIEPLYLWAKGLRFFQFGTSLGKEKVAIFGVKDAPAFDPSVTDQVAAAFREGHKLVGDAFSAAVISDMREIGYDLERVGLHALPDVEIEPGKLPGEPQAVFVQERSLQMETEQPFMSQGMFRALSLIVQVNYGVVSKSPSCILIDDIGEGLDFERSCSLITLLMKKAEDSNVQLIMSTNDRFVMNKVPLEYWAVIHREGHRCRLYNYGNSKDVFDSFKFTGLNNFDFFASDFLEKRTVNPPEEQTAPAQ